jgi:hypothetical protein
MIHILRSRATPEQMQQMLESLGIYLKLAVDVEQNILAGGGELHYECEEALLEAGSNQSNLWGANWYPNKQRIEYESLINIRPRDNNRSMEVQDYQIREKIKEIVQHLLGDMSWQ